MPPKEGRLRYLRFVDHTTMLKAHVTTMRPNYILYKRDLHRSTRRRGAVGHGLQYSSLARRNSSYRLATNASHSDHLR